MGLGHKRMDHTGGSRRRLRHALQTRSQPHWQAGGPFAGGAQPEWCSRRLMHSLSTTLQSSISYANTRQHVMVVRPHCCRAAAADGGRPSPSNPVKPAATRRLECNAALRAAPVANMNSWVPMAQEAQRHAEMQDAEEIHARTAHRLVAGCHLHRRRYVLACVALSRCVSHLTS